MEELKLRIVVLGLAGSGVTSFIKSIHEGGYPSVSPNPDHLRNPNVIHGDFGECLLGESLRLQIIGFKDWTIWFTWEEFWPFIDGAHGFIVIVDSAEPASISN